MLQNTAHTKPWNLELLTELSSFIFKSWLEKCFEVTQSTQKLKCKGDLGKLWPKVCFLRES